MRINVLFLIALALCFSMVKSVAADAVEELSTSLMRDRVDSAPEFMVTTWKTGDGLPSNDLQEIRSTPDGYLWIGSYLGLVRFDGIQFKTFFSSPTGARYGRRIGPLEVDSLGQLWIAPDQVGLMYRTPEGFSEVLTNDPALHLRVESLCSDGAGRIYWVEDDGSLGRASVEPPITAERIQGGGASGASRWMRDFEGRLWLANPRNIKLFEDGKWSAVEFPGNATLVAAPRRAGGIWVAREAKLRVVTADGVYREVATFPWIGQSRVNCLLEDRQQRLWIGTVGQGLFCYANGEFQQVVSTASSITGLFEDEHGNIWAGTRGNGLMRVRQRQFFIHDLSSGLPNEFVRSLSQDIEGRVWLLTAEGGLGWWHNNAWRSFGPGDGWPGHDSMAVAPSRDGGVWISTRRGLWRWAKGKFARRNLGPKGPKEPVVDLLEDRQGRLWMVTDNSGVFCLEGNKLSRYTAQEGLPSNLIRCLVQDESGTLWAGDWEGGIARFNERQWESMRAPSGHGDAVRSMAFSSNALWIGTSAGGLLRLQNGSSARVSREQGLPDECIQQLVLDREGSLWGGTPHTLFRIGMDDLNDVADGLKGYLTPVTYGRGDGLPDVSFASWCDPRTWRASNGELWFATANGAIHFRPGDLEVAEPPRVLMEQILFNGKELPASALKRLRPQVGRLELRFTAPCLTAPERVRYRYQLVGVDPDWVDAGVSRSASYANLPPGDHMFRVVASSPEGVWGNQPATVAISVHPFFWQTSWFLAAIAAVIAGGVAWGVRRATVRRLNWRLERLRQQRMVDKERARIAQDIHDELGANLTSIGLLADLGNRQKTNPKAVARELDQISQTARESVAAMDAIVWALNPRNDSLDHFANYVAQFTREFFRPTRIRTRLELPANLPEHPLGTEVRHQLFLLVKESFNNIVRHAAATEVCVEMACDEDQLRMVIADNGKGISPKTVSTGQNGLSNLRDRIERLGGTLQIHSQNGCGARLEFILPLSRFGNKERIYDAESSHC